MRCPGGFHRFQGIRARRFTLSTAGLYDLYTRYGQTVDKKALLPDLRNYPQVPPQPEGPLYRGFQVHKYLQNQLDNAFLHEIWAYHHHHALDLYPDLEARPAPIRPQRDLWTVASADEATAALRPTICFTPPASSGNVHQSEDPERHTRSKAAGQRPSSQPGFQSLSTDCIGRAARINRQPAISRKAFTHTWRSGHRDAPRGTCKKNAREGPGRRSVPRGTGCRQRRSGITTWRDFSLLDSRTSAEELESRSWMMTSSSRRADRASSR